MMSIPRDKSLDSTFALLTEGYAFISNRCERLQSDMFETRLMLRKAVCAKGAEAAEMFYQPGHFTRKHVLPPTTLMLFQDRGSLQVMDGAAHHRRKQMFMVMMTADRLDALTTIFEVHWKTVSRNGRRSMRWCCTMKSSSCCAARCANGPVCRSPKPLCGNARGSSPP